MTATTATRATTEQAIVDAITTGAEACQDCTYAATHTMTQNELAAATGRGRSTVTEALGRMVADGRVARYAGGRVTRYGLTAATITAVDTTPAPAPAAPVDEDTTGVSAATPAGTDSWDAARFDEDVTVPRAAVQDVPEDAPVAAGTPALAESCHCADDAVGHVHPRRITAAAAPAAADKGARRPARAAESTTTREGKAARARAAALAALAGGPMTVDAVWAAMEVGAGMAHQGAYVTLNNMIREGAVTVSAERLLKDRTVSLPGAAG